jgi:hypothetical protein
MICFFCLNDTKDAKPVSFTFSENEDLLNEPGHICPRCLKSISIELGHIRRLRRLENSIPLNPNYGLKARLANEKKSKKSKNRQENK